MSTVLNFIEQALQTNLVPNLPEYKFYGGQVTVYYDDAAHSYTRFRDDGEYTEIDGVTTIVHVIDKSEALTPWGAKMARNYALSKIEPGKTYTKEELEQILNEAAKHFREVAENAADIGKAAHNCLEASIRKAMAETNGVVIELVDLPYAGMKINGVVLGESQAEAARNCALHGFEWMKNHNVRWLETERKVYHRIYDYAGTMDGLAVVDACGDPECCYQIVDGRRVPATFMDVLSLIDWKSSNYLYDEYRFQTAAYEAQHEDEFNVDIQMRWVLRLGKTEGDFEPWRIPHEDFSQDFLAFLECLDLTRSLKAVKLRERDRKEELKTALKGEKAEAKAAEKEAKKAAKLAEKLAKAEAKAAEKAANARAHVKKRRKKKTDNDSVGVIPEIGELPTELVQ